jgi:hypothetical protein
LELSRWIAEALMIPSEYMTPARRTAIERSPYGGVSLHTENEWRIERVQADPDGSVWQSTEEMRERFAERMERQLENLIHGEFMTEEEAYGQGEIRRTKAANAIKVTCPDCEGKIDPILDNMTDGEVGFCKTCCGTGLVVSND